MKKLSLMLAFVGLISTATFAGNYQQEPKKQTTEKTQTVKKQHQKEPVKKIESHPKRSDYNSKKTDSKTKQNHTNQHREPINDGMK